MAWKGTISFSLVNIPVALHPAAVPDHGLNLHLLHKTDHSPIRFARVCREDGREVPWKDIVKGYEFGKGDYVVIDQKELEKAAARRTGSIEIMSFVNEKEIESIYYDKPYYIEAVKGAEKSYALLREALKASKKVGLARIIFSSREHVAAINEEDGALMLNTLRFESDIRRPDLNVPARYSGRKQELDLALKLIGQMSEPFNPRQYKDTYTAELESLIERKAKGRPLPKPRAKEKEATRVPDLMAALRASLGSSSRAESRTMH